MSAAQPILQPVLFCKYLNESEYGERINYIEIVSMMLI